MTARDPADLSFETPRVKARLLCEDDLDLYLALYTDPEVMRYIGPVMGREAAEAQFRKSIILNEESCGMVRYWAGCSVEESGVARMSILSAALTDQTPRSFEVGIMMLGSKWRMGYGNALLQGLVGCLFNASRFNADVVMARHLAENTGAQSLFSRLGFSNLMHNDSKMKLCSMSSQQWLQRTVFCHRI